MKVFSLAVVLVPVLSFAGSYEMADLKALEKSSGWKELVDHLEDIPPSKRDKEWEGLAERAAANYIGGIEIKDGRDAEAPLVAADAFLKKFPQMKQSKVFMAKRAEVAIKSFKFSFSNYRHSSGDDEWLKKMRTFVEQDTVNTDLPVRFAKEVILSRLIPVTAFPFFKMGLDRGNKGLCKDADFQKTMVDTIADGSWKDEAQAILQNTCFDDLKGPVGAAIMKQDRNAPRRNLCAALAPKNAIPEAAKAECARE